MHYCVCNVYFERGCMTGIKVSKWEPLHKEGAMTDLYRALLYGTMNTRFRIEKNTVGFLYSGVVESWLCTQENLPVRSLRGKTE